MFLPVESTVDAVHEFIALMNEPFLKDTHDPSVYLSVMVRYIKADDIALSPMRGRDSAVLSIIVVGDGETTGDQAEFDRYAQTLEALCQREYEGRPHWGKRNSAKKDYISRAYTDGYDEFVAVRAAMDPDHLFSNDYLDQRL